MANLSQIREVSPTGGRAIFTAYNKKIADDIASKLAQPERRLEPSPQQEAIFAWVQDFGKSEAPGWEEAGQWQYSRNAIIEAVAGAGKTTTLIKICKLLNMQVSAGTFHSIGLRAWSSAVGRPQVKGEKLDDIMEELDVPSALRAFVGRLVSLGKQRGVWIPGLSSATGMAEWLQIIEHFDLEEVLPAYMTVEQGIEWVGKVLHESIKRADALIDFDDMIYMPLYSEVAIPQYDWVLVDELQDTNPTRRELARRMLSPSGRFIGVGDPHQAIYGFTGADNDAMEIVRRTFNCITLPLTVTYRCPQEVVAFAQQWVSHIQAHESAPRGAVRAIDLQAFRQQVCVATPQGGAMGTTLPPISERTPFVPLRVSDAILCRNTRPLIELAFDLIKKRIPAHVEGREIGQGLITLCKKWRSARTVQDLKYNLKDYLESETAKLLKRRRADKVAALEDKVGTVLVFIEALAPGDPVTKLIDSINSLFKDTDTGRRAATVTLSTVHKSKGREWPRVFLLDRAGLMPSRFARQQWQLEQEKNLIYVAVTRAMEELVEVVYPQAGTAPLVEDEKYEVVGGEGPGIEDLVGLRVSATIRDDRITSLRSSEIQSSLEKRPAQQLFDETFARNCFRSPSGEHLFGAEGAPCFWCGTPPRVALRKQELSILVADDLTSIPNDRQLEASKEWYKEIEPLFRPLGGLAFPKEPSK